MDTLLLYAGILLCTIGLTHSVLGEYLIFRHQHKTLIFSEKSTGIVWATWHLASIFGFAIAAILIQLAYSEDKNTTIVNVVAISMFIASLLVCFATKARHPGWIGLLFVAIMCWLGPVNTN